MIKKAIPLLLHPHFTKVSSVFIGYMLWFFVSQLQWTTIEFNAPICFFSPTDRTIQAEEQVRIKIAGFRKDIYQFDPEAITIHIDTTNMDPGSHFIALQKENLLLPEALKLVQLIPSTITCSIKNNEINTSTNTQIKDTQIKDFQVKNE